jgi:hypothetical protein
MSRQGNPFVGHAREVLAAVSANPGFPAAGVRGIPATPPARRT